MKKFITTILAILYLATSSGATIHLHYCMGKLAGWAFNYTESTTCPKCGMDKCSKKSNDCCKDEHKFLKVDSAQKNIEYNLFLTPFFAIVPTYFYNQLQVLAIPSVIENIPNSNAPPLGKNVPLYISYCVFLI